MNDNNVKKGNGGVAAIIIAEALFTAAVILSVITVKYFFGTCYSDVRKWYEKEICTDTDADEVLSLFEGVSK